MTTKPLFETVVAEQGATVLRVCRALLGPHADADDAWSETFLSAMKAWPELPVEANVEAWLVRIAHRKAIDVVRARGRRAVPSERLDETVSTLGVPDAGRLDVWAALQSLPEKQRRTVAYHHLAGLPYQDIAELLGGTPEAARRAAADGMKTLRRLLVNDSPKGANP